MSIQDEIDTLTNQIKRLEAKIEHVAATSAPQTISELRKKYTGDSIGKTAMTALELERVQRRDAAVARELALFKRREDLESEIRSLRANDRSREERVRAAAESAAWWAENGLAPVAPLNGLRPEWLEARSFVSEVRATAEGYRKGPHDEGYRGSHLVVLSRLSWLQTMVRAPKESPRQVLACAHPVGLEKAGRYGGVEEVGLFALEPGENLWGDALIWERVKDRMVAPPDGVIRVVVDLHLHEGMHQLRFVDLVTSTAFDTESAHLRAIASGDTEAMAARLAAAERELAALPTSVV